MSGLFIIAEAGVNHNGSQAVARKLVEAAANAGADAVKFQTFKAERFVSRWAAKAIYQSKTTEATESQLEMLKRLELSENDHYELFKYCRQCGIIFLSTPFDAESLVFLADELKVCRLKISSGEVTNGPFLLHAARTGLPIILSTGMSTLAEIEAALGVLALGYSDSSAAPSKEAFRVAYKSQAGQKALQDKVTLLHCTTEYPAYFDEVNLRAMNKMHDTFGLAVGYSDHTSGLHVPIAAVARGAVVLEKHFTLDRNMPGPDHKASLEPHELKQMVRMVREVETALGNSEKQPTTSELKNMMVARKSLVALKSIKAGEYFTIENLGVKRPGSGISPMAYWDWVGRVAQWDYEEDELIGS